MARRFFGNAFAHDLGIDLGTAHCLVYRRGKGIIIAEPSVVALDRRTWEILAVGNEAKKMIGRNPESIMIVRPLKAGVIADFEITKRMLNYFITKAFRRKPFVRPRVVVSIPSGITSVEKRAVLDAAIQAGAREAFLMEEPVAAAIGAGIPIQEAVGSMVLSIGGGITEVAIVALGGVVTSKSIRVGGDEMDEAIIRYVRRVYNVIIGERTAERVKIEIGSAYPPDNQEKAIVKGNDLTTGLPKTLELSGGEVHEALRDPVNAIIHTIKSALEKTPPELSSDIIERGVVMTGGGSLLRGLDRLIAEETRLPAHLAEDPLSCAALGTGKALEEIDSLQRILVSRRQMS